MSVARAWSSQKPGSPIACSSSVSRARSESGSKVITDPRKAGPDLLELLVQALADLGHASTLAVALAQQEKQAGERLRVAELVEPARDLGDRPAHDLDLLVLVAACLALLDPGREVEGHVLVAEARRRPEAGGAA